MSFFDFSGKKTKAQKAEESLKGMSAEQKAYALAYRDRAQQERKRFVEATDTEFWLCLCFTSMSQLAEWRKTFGFGELHGFARYEDVKDRLGVKPRKTDGGPSFGYGPSFGAGPSFGSGPSFGDGPSFGKVKYDPLADVQYTDDLEADSLAELVALHEAFVQARAPEPLTDVLDSDIWTVLVFKDRDAKDAFISDAGAVRDQQDKYVDAAKLAAHLGASI